MPSAIWNGVVIVDAAISSSAACPRPRNVAGEIAGPLAFPARRRHGRAVNGRLGCREVRRTLQSFLDGEVEPWQAELVAAHLESCSRCHVEAEVLAQVIEAIQRVRPDLDLAAYTRLVAGVEDVTGRGHPL